MEALLNRSKNVLVLVLVVSLATTLVSSSVSAVDPQAVKLAFYYESLCPYCADFIANEMPKMYDNGLINIVDFKFSPYGNAELEPNGTIVCQHGEWECRLNTVEACAIHAWPNMDDHFPFIHCVESLSSYKDWKTCFKKLNLDPKPVTHCMSSGLGHELELQYANETSSLEPPHQFVPWVVVDGEPLYNHYEDFTTYVCNAYKGSNVPQACHELSLPNYSAKPLNNACYKDDDNAKSKS